MTDTNPASRDIATCYEPEPRLIGGGAKATIRWFRDPPDAARPYQVATIWGTTSGPSSAPDRCTWHATEGAAIKAAAARGYTDVVRA